MIANDEGQKGPMPPGRFGARPPEARIPPIRNPHFTPKCGACNYPMIESDEGECPRCGERRETP